MQHADSFHCLEEAWRDCEELEPVQTENHRTEWCVVTSRHCCMRCQRNSKKMKITGKCEGPRWTGMALSFGNEWPDAHKKEELALLQVSQNKQKPDTMVRRAVKAGLADGWSDLVRSEEINPSWMVAKLKDSHNQARQEDVRRKSVVEKVMQRSTNSLRRIIVPVHCHCFPLEDCIWWVSLGARLCAKSSKKQCNWSALHAAERDPNRALVIQDGAVASRATSAT